MAKRQNARLDDPRTWSTRTIRVRKGKKEYEQYRDVQVVPLSRGMIGWIDAKGRMVYFRHSIRNWVVMLMAGVFAAYRAFCHILDNQIEEMPKVEQVRNAIRDLPIELRLIDATSLIEYGVLDMKRTIYEQLDVLGAVLDANKVEATKHMRLLALMRDSRNRVNIGVLLCRQVTAVDRLEARCEALKHMHLRVQYKRQVLMMLIGANEQTLERVRLQYDELYDTIRLLANSKTDRERATPLRALSRITAAIMMNLDKLTLQPYLRTARHLVKEIRLIRIEVTASSWKRAQRIADRGRVSIAIKQLQKPMELAILHVMRAARNGPMDPALLEQLRAGLQRVVDIFRRMYDDDFELKVRDEALLHARQALLLLSLPDPPYLEIRQEIDQALLRL